MKKKLSTTLLTITAALAFADESTLKHSLSANALPLEAKKTAPIEEMPSKSFTYLKMGVGDSHPTDSFQVIPGIGLGYRLVAGSGALDLSANYTGGKGINGEKKAFFWTLPKASYLRYITPARDQSLYAGLGMAWGALKTKDGREFRGLIPSATVGYEMNRKASWRSFVELAVSQPAVAASLTKPFPGPVAEFSVGAGF